MTANTRRLTTANISHVSICVTKIFEQDWGRGRSCKNFLLTVQNLVVMCHALCAYLGVVLFGLIATAVGHELFKHMCHHTEFGRCMSNRMGVSGPKTSDTLRPRRFVMGVSD